MKIDFLFSFLKLLAETKDQKTFFNHLFIIEDTYKDYRAIKDYNFLAASSNFTENAEKFKNIFEKLCRTIIIELYYIMINVKKGKLCIKNQPFFLKSVELFKNRINSEIRKNKNPNIIVFFKAMNYLSDFNIKLIKKEM